MLTNFGITIVVAIGLWVVGALAYEWLRRQHNEPLLRSRPQLESADFGAKFFGGSSEKVALAAKVRDLLAANLKLNLDGLQPDDRLQEDLNAELPANPELFRALHRELGVETPTDDFTAFTQRVQSLCTFRDLVAYAERHRSAVSAESETAASEG